MKNKQKYSQVFLRNKNVQKRIADAINNSKYDIILEIGPGCGQISQNLELSKKEYIGVEIDSSLCSFLNTKLPYLKVLNRNFLDLTREEILESVSKEAPILLFGNIPYHISTEILFKFLKIDVFKEAYFTVQKEFFEVISAPLNSKKYSSLSVLFQSFCKIQKLFLIDRLNFFPKPKVDSIFLSLKKEWSPGEEDLIDYSLFVKKCFSKPRKVLWNNLVSEELDSSKLLEVFDKNNLSHKTRVHQLKPLDIYKLFLSFK